MAAKKSLGDLQNAVRIFKEKPISVPNKAPTSGVAFLSHLATEIKSPEVGAAVRAAVLANKKRHEELFSLLDTLLNISIYNLYGDSEERPALVKRLKEELENPSLNPNASDGENLLLDGLIRVCLKLELTNLLTGFLTRLPTVQWETVNNLEIQIDLIRLKIY